MFHRGKNSVRRHLGSQQPAQCPRTPTASSVEDKEEAQQMGAFIPLVFSPLSSDAGIEPGAQSFRCHSRGREKVEFREQSLELPFGRGPSQSKGLARARCKTVSMKSANQRG